MYKDLALTPVLTENTYALGKEKNVYVFKAPLRSNKHSIAKAIEAQFSVSVTAVNTTRIAGKSKRTISITGKRQSNKNGNQLDYKKAYISLKEGDKLPILEGIDEAEAKREKTQEKFDKALNAQSEKEVKKAIKAEAPKRRFFGSKRPEGS